MIYLDEERYVTGLKIFTSMTLCKNPDLSYDLSKFCNILASVISSLVISTAYFDIEEDCAQYPSQVPLGEFTTITCGSGRIASSVQIRKSDGGSLHLCEVEILARLSKDIFACMIKLVLLGIILSSL